MLQAKVRVPLMKRLLQGLEAINEEAIFQFSPDGLNVRVVDSNRWKMLNVNMAVEGFQDFQCDGDYECGIVFSRIKDIAKTLTAKDELVIQYDGENFVLLANGIERTIKLLKLELMNEILDWPSFDYSYNASFSAKEAKDFLRTLGDTGSFDINVEEGGLQWESNNKDEPIIWKPTNPTVMLEETSQTTYSTDQVLGGLAAAKTEEIILKGGTDMPCQFTWIPEEGVQVSALVANRV